MDKLEARKALNRLQIVYKRLKARCKEGMPMLFYKDDDVYKIGEDASNLYLYCQIEKDIEVMKECSMFPRYLHAQIVTRKNQKNDKQDMAFFSSMKKASDYLIEIETLYICTCWGLTEKEANSYFIDKEDGQCKSKVTREVLEIPTYTDVYERTEKEESLKIAPKSPQITERQTQSLDDKLNFVDRKYKERTKNAFSRLLSDEKMIETEEGICWIGTKALLAYTMEKILCVNCTDQFPETALNNLFGVSRLGQARHQIYQNTTGKPRGSEEIDLLLSDCLD